MKTLYLLILTLACGLTPLSAHPSDISNKLQSLNPAPIMKRAMPTFVNYKNSGSDAQKVAQIQQGVRDMVTMLRAVMTIDAVTFELFMRTYFGTSDPRYSFAVREMLINLLEPSADPATGADNLKYTTFEGNDITNSCHNMHDTVVAYTWEKYGHGARIHICDKVNADAFVFPQLSDLSCDSVGNEVSYKMMCLGSGVLLHEFMHVNLTNFETMKEFAIPPDHWIADYGYGPQEVRTLAQGRATNDDGPISWQYSLGNADSYAWMVTEMYWTQRCGRNFAGPTTNKNTPSGFRTSQCVIL